MINAINSSDTILNEYINTIIEQSIYNGRLYWKNDIIDAQILSELTNNDIIITADKDMIEHMKNMATLFSNSLDTIANLE